MRKVRWLDQDCNKCGRHFSFEIQNVRAGQRESRDLMQDLEDIRNGIQIIHASDAEKRNEENKKERRQKLRESAVRRLEKKLLENGYESLERLFGTAILFFFPVFFIRSLIPFQL